MCSIHGCCGQLFSDYMCWSHFYGTCDSVTEVTLADLDNHSYV